MAAGMIRATYALSHWNDERRERKCLSFPSFPYLQQLAAVATKARTRASLFTEGDRGPVGDLIYTLHNPGLKEGLPLCRCSASLNPRLCFLKVTEVKKRSLLRVFAKARCPPSQRCCLLGPSVGTSRGDLIRGNGADGYIIVQSCERRDEGER